MNGPYPKRLKRDMRTCHECRKRKVRCQVTAESEPACMQCMRRGLDCHITAADSEGAGASSQSSDERLERIEQLLERLTEQSNFSRSIGNLNATSTLNADISTESLDVPYLPETSPIDILFRNNLFSRLGSIPGSRNRGSRSMINRNSQHRTRDEIIRQTFIDLLPSQEDASIIFQHTNAWALGMSNLPGATLELSDRDSCFSMESDKQMNSVFLAKTLLYLALCIQQLPPTFDNSKLQLSYLESVADTYTSTVATLALANDELVYSMEGLECLALRGMIQINSGAIQKAWMTFRRALDIARVLGLPGSYYSPARESRLQDSISQRRMWHSLIMADSYLSLLLGHEDAGGNKPFGPEPLLEAPSEDANIMFQRRLCLVCKDLNQRNLSDEKLEYATVISADEALVKLENDMSQSWWLASPPNTQRSAESSSQLDCILCHIWFFQINILNHLSYSYRTGKEGQFEYSRLRSLEASRSLLQRYLILQGIENTQLHCRVVDFAAFVASITIILLQLQKIGTWPSMISNQHDSRDSGLVKEVIQSMDMLGKSGCREVVARQGAEVLQKLMRLHDNPPETVESLQLKIPYFGTISVFWRGDSVYRVNQQIVDSLEPPNQGDTFRPAEPGEAAAGSFQLHFSNVYGTAQNEIPPSCNFEGLDTLIFDSIWEPDILRLDP